MIPIEVNARSAGLPRAFRTVRHANERPVLPLAFPTLEHLVERLEDVAVRAKNVEGLQPHTIARWGVARRSFAAFLALDNRRNRFVGGDFRVQTVLIEDWMAWLRTRDRSRATIATYWRSLATQLGRVAREDGVVNPFSLLRAPKPGRVLPRSLNRHQAEALFSLVRNEQCGSTLARARNVCLVGLLMFAGLRRAEALSIEVADCDTDLRTLVVRHGKGRDGGEPRTSYMNAQLVLIIATYLSERERARPKRTHAALLTSTSGDRPASEITVRRLFRRWSQSLGFHVTPHMLRHTYALLLRQAGVPDRVSMDLLGHRSLSMLQRYSHVFDGEHLGEAAKVRLDLDDPFAGSSSRVTPPDRDHR